MIRKITLGSIALCAISLGAVSFAPPATAQTTATLLGAFGNWSAYSAGTGAAMTCYAISKPRAVQPRTAKRGGIFLMFSDWPARKVKGEAEIVLGYPAKEGGDSSLTVGSDKFTFFMRNEGKDGTAWLRSLNDGTRLLDSMKNNVSAVARGVSSRGTKTDDTYALAGFNDALAKIHAACNM